MPDAESLGKVQTPHPPPKLSKAGGRREFLFDRPDIASLHSLVRSMVQRARHPWR